MIDRLVKSVALGVVFALISSLFISLIITLLLYFEAINVGLASRVSYVSFATILFIASFITARKIGSRGLFVGLGIASAIILFGALYRFIGIESGVGVSFAIRSTIIVLVATTGAVAGVNTVK